MKKYLVAVLMTMYAGAAFAENDTVSLLPDSRAISLTAEPTFTFFAVDASSTAVRRLPNNHTFTRDRLTDQFCWQVTNLPANKRLYNVDVEIIAPSVTSFMDDKGNRIRGMSSVTNLQMEAVEGRINSCGSFEANDPAGDYQVIVSVEGKKYPAQTMTLR